MFSLQSPDRFLASAAALGAKVAGAVRRSRIRAVVRPGLLVFLLTATLPDGASAQALGTMQVTARVLPGQPGWAAISEASAMARQVASTGGARTRRAGLVQTQAEVASVQGRRRLLITVHYPHN